MKYMKIGQLQWFAFWLMIINLQHPTYALLWLITLFMDNK